MPSTTQSSLSAEKGNTVSKQPAPSQAMSTDPNAPARRAMRLRGGCLVRHSVHLSASMITYTFSRNATCPVGAAMSGAAFKF